MEGPVAADSVYYLALKGKYDVFCRLPRPGHIATKWLILREQFR